MGLGYAQRRICTGKWEGGQGWGGVGWVGRDQVGLWDSFGDRVWRPVPLGPAGRD